MTNHTRTSYPQDDGWHTCPHVKRPLSLYREMPGDNKALAVAWNLLVAVTCGLVAGCLIASKTHTFTATALAIATVWCLLRGIWLSRKHMCYFHVPDDYVPTYKWPLHVLKRIRRH